MTPPAKKAVPSLKDALKGNKDEEIVQDDPVVEEKPVVEDDSVLVPSDKDHVHTWTEDPDQNLARLQKDVVVPGPVSESAQTQVTGFVTVYAGPAETDDKGIVGPPETGVDPEPKSDDEVVE